MGLRDLYYKLEEKYYNFLDKLDKKGIPVYSVIDPIDKVIPSFVLFLLLFGVLIIAIIYAIVINLGLQTTNVVSVTFTDKLETPLPNAGVTFSINGSPQPKATTNELGIIQFKANPGDEVIFTLVYEGKSYVNTLKIKDKETTYKIKIDQLNLSKKKLSFSLYTTDNSPLQPVNIYFACSNTTAEAPSSITNNTKYDVDVEVDSDCGSLKVSIMSDYYDPTEKSIDNSGYSIALKPIQQSGNGVIVVNAVDESGAQVTDFSVDLCIGQYMGFLETKYSEETSQVVFTGLSPGSYTVTVTKEGYEQGKVSLALAEDEKKTIEVTMKKIDNGVNLIIKVVNVSKKALEGVEVCFYDINGTTYNKLDCRTTDKNGLTSYMLAANKTYKYTAKKEGYTTIKYTDITVVPNMSALELTMSPGDKTKYRLMKAKVVDSEGRPVSNAMVQIYEIKDGIENIAPYKPLTTDVNGMVYFGCSKGECIEDGEYRLFAYKLSFSGFSDKGFFYNADELKELDYIVSMYIPKGTISITVTDTYGNVVPNAIVKFFDASWSEITELGGKHTDGFGQLGVEYRADKKLFFVVEKDGYENYISKAEYIVQDTTTEKRVVMEKKKLKPEPKIEYIGLTKEDGTDVAILSPGNSYIAKFKLTLPQQGKPFTQMNAYFIAGDKDIVEKDGWYIEKVVYSGLTIVSKGRSYTGNKDIDTKEITVVGNELEQGIPFEDTIKWVGLEWKLKDMKIESGVFFVDVYLRVKETTKVGENLPINFKMFAKDSNDNLYTDPLELNFKELSSPLYAESKNKFFTVGTTQQTCDELFCFEINIEDLEEEIIQDLVPDTPYVADLGKKYKLTFKLINNNIKPLTNYRVKIENSQENIFFLDSIIKGVSGNVAPPLNKEVAKPENNYLIVYKEEKYSELLKNDLVFGEITFEPRKVGSGSIKFTVIQDKQEYYSKEFLVNVNASKELSVDITPAVLPSYITLKLDVLVKDKETGELVQGAKIYVKDNSGMVLFQGETDVYGKAIIDLPSQKPNVLIKILIYKPKYKSFEAEYKTSAEFVTLDKEEINFTVDAKVGIAKEKLVLTNTSEVPVTIEDVFVQGNFAERISLSQINSYLGNAYKGKEFDNSLKYTLEIPITLTETGKAITSNEEYDAVLVIKLSAMGGKWEVKVPLHFFLSLGGNVDEKGCLAADLKTIKLVSTESKQDKQTLVITNGCTVKGTPIGLDNLEAKIEWKTNAVGSIQMTKDEYSNRLMSAYYTSLINKLTPGNEYTFVINIEPTVKVSGKGEAVLHLRALNNTENGPEYLTLDIPIEVDIVNYGECIEFELPNGETDIISTLRDTETSFKVTNTCDEKIELTFKLRPVDTVLITPDKVMLKAKETKDIKVKPNNSAIGIYTLDVFGRTEGHTNEGIRVGINALRVLLQPLASDCFYLENYEFDMAQNENETRWTTLVNKCVNKQAVVQYELKIKPEMNWGNAILSSLGAGLAAFAGGKFLGPQVAQAISSISAAASTSSTAGKFGMVMLNAAEASNPDTSTSKDKNKLSWKEVTANGIAAAGAASGASYLLGSIMGVDPLSQKASTWGAGLGGLTGGVIGSLFGGLWGPLGGAIGAAAGNFVGYAYIAATDPTISTLTRTVPTMIENYIQIKDANLTAQPQKALQGGSGVQGDKEYIVFDSNNKLVKGIGEQAIELYPIGFKKSEAIKKVQNLTLLLNYKRRNLQNLVASEPYGSAGWTQQQGGISTGDSGIKQYEMPSAFGVIGLQAEPDTMTYDDAIDQAKVDAKDREKVKDALADTKSMISEYVPMSILFTDVAEQEKKYNLPIENCFLANGKTGATGPAAKPRVAFEWSWDAVTKYKGQEGKYMCSDRNIYCDATQFMIEVIDRLYKANTKLHTFGFIPEKTKVLFLDNKEIPSQYIGVSQVKIEKNKKESYDLTVEFTNNSLDTVTGNYIIKLVDTQQTKDVKTISGTFTMEPKTNKQETIQDINLYYTTYRVEVQFSEVKKEDGLPFNHVIPYTSNVFTYDDKAIFGLEESTEKIIEWGIIAEKGEDANKIWNLLNFKAYLMKDGFTLDFLKDFKEYALNQQFMKAPDYIQKIISNLLPENIEFLPKESALNAPGYSLPKAGLYNVEIVVKYKKIDRSWNIFFGKDLKIAETVDSIKVYLEPVQFSDNPLYYLPLDATVGVENYELKREGYGLDFSGDTIWFTEQTADNPTLIPTLISKSNPQVRALIEVKQDMETLNKTKGMVLKVIPHGAQADTVVRKIMYYPSVPAPVAIHLHKEFDGPAYFAYIISRPNKGPVNAGDSLINWYGFCNEPSGSSSEPSDLSNELSSSFFDRLSSVFKKYKPVKEEDKEYACKGLSGEDIVDLQGIPDTIGTKMDIPLGEFKANAYGMYWDEQSLLRTPETSDLFLRGIVYLVPGETAIFKKITASDDMKVVTLKTGLQYSSNDELPLKPLEENVSTVQRVYELVDQNLICVTNPEGGAGVEFWWNPAKVFEGLSKGQ